MMPDKCGKKDCFWNKESVLGIETQALYFDIYGKNAGGYIHPCNQCKKNEKYLIQRLKDSLGNNFIKNKRSKNAWIFKDKDVHIKTACGDKFSCGYCKDGAGVPSFKLHTIFSEKGKEYGCVDNKQICFKCLISLGKSGVEELKKKIRKEVEDFHNNLK